LSQDERRLLALSAGGAFCLLVMLFVVWPAPGAILLLGVITGSLSALTAMGIVLVYRANQIVNFAQASLGAIAAVLAASLIAGPNWSFWLASAVGLAAALALGGLVEVLFVRRFARSPRLVLTVATIGVAQLCDAGALLTPKLFDLDEIPQPTPIDWTFTWAPYTFNGGHLLIMIVVPLVAVGLALFFRRSRFGIAMRASAESADRASLLGIPVKRVNTLVWVMAAGLAGLATILALPTQGVAIGSVGGPTVMMIALGAAVTARMERLWVAFGMSLVLGMIEQAVQFQTGQTYASYAVVLAVILAALLFQRGSLERARLTGVAAWAGQREVRPIPRELRRLPEIRIGVPMLAAVGAALLLFLPLQWNPSRVGLFTGGVIVAMVLLSLLIITGFAGQISLGQLAVVSFSSAVAGSMSQNGTELFQTIAVAGLVGAGVSLVLGIPALRMSGPFFAVTSLAFAVATGTFFLNPQYFRWLRPEENVRVLRPVVFDKFDLESNWSFYYFVLVFFALSVAAAARIRSSRTGRAIVANRENTRAAQAYGINARNAGLTAFGLGGFIAGVAGALNVYYLHGLSVDYLNVDTGILVFAIAIVGGLGSVPGALIGAAYLTFLDNSPFTASPLSQLFASGVGVLLVLMVLPGGLGGLVYDLRDGLLRRIARRHGVVVPSLLADLRVDDDGNPYDASEPEPAGARVRAALSRPAEALRERRALRAQRHVVETQLEGTGPLLTVRGLEVSYGKTQVLFGVDCHVDRHEIVALLGTNGAGKSTLLSAIAGLNRPSRGSIVLDGHDITGQRPTETVAEGVVFMPGGKGVFPTLTVAENLQLAGWLYKDDPAYVAEVTEQVLGFFPVLRERLDQRAGNLSGGEQQMLTLAQAFILKPKLLMIDELSLGLAPIIVEQLLEIVRSIHRSGTTVVLVEQSVNVAISLAERAIFLEKGEVRFDGPTADLLDRPDVLRAVFLEGQRSPDDRRSAVHERTAFESSCTHCGHEHPVALEVHDLAVSFGGIQAVRDVSFDVRQGQIVGIIGPNGAGKTTVLDLISGFVAPTSGRVEIGGVDVTALPPDARAVLGLGRSFQDARLFSAMTVRQTIATAFERHVRVRDAIAPLVLSPAVAASERAVAEEVDALIELMNLGAYADKFVGELSTGTRRVVDLACTLAHRPSVLLLDEPSSGIAQRETEALGPLLLDIRDKTGAALVVIEHDMPLICGVSDELIALELGAVIARGQPDDVINDPRVVEGYLGGTEEVIFRSGGDGQGAGTPTTAPAKTARTRRTPLKAAP
jgi:ABC-type branched-subunit amino acid transport system ATPase component/branched-subunit amino acid ABC-type transport system permease component